jgi:hypothetical protein
MVWDVAVDTGRIAKQARTLHGAGYRRRSGCRLAGGVAGPVARRSGTAGGSRRSRAGSLYTGRIGLWT